MGIRWPLARVALAAWVGSACCPASAGEAAPTASPWVVKTQAYCAAQFASEAYVRSLENHVPEWLRELARSGPAEYERFCRCVAEREYAIHPQAVRAYMDREARGETLNADERRDYDLQRSRCGLITLWAIQDCVERK